jgi:enediyne polyketide synthase
MTEPIAIVGIACRYPDASTPAQLWENVLAGRRAFRQIPDERLRLEDYWSADPAAPDRFYARKAAVIDGFEFDRVKYKIAGSTFRTTDLTHWLALDTAARALEDAGFPDGDGLPRTGTAVIVGNTLTGEFTRASLMRLRWPYVRRTVTAALQQEGWDDGRLAGFLAGLEARYKSAFPPVDEDTLAGGLSNTIAGRICNQFDLGGGGFTVDGACSSSLLSVLTACNALRDHTADAAVAGGVDLSIDPFELIGFAKTGALSTSDMRVYDRGSNGFWPGEGCGMLVLLRQDDAEARGLRVYATIAGWGFSSDGRGGITRPEASGHRLAIDRAYQQAGFGIATVGYLEGHGTGTAVGDATELTAFSEARRAFRPSGPPAAISTIKGNIGHTKAAAGVAGLIKATMAVYHQVIPPATGHVNPHPMLTGDSPALRVPLTAELWPDGQPIRAGVSSMGFGGINAHVVIAGDDTIRRGDIDARTTLLVSSRQDCEVLLLRAADPTELRDLTTRVAALAGRLSHAELGDLAATLARQAGAQSDQDHPMRAAVVARSPDEAAERLGQLLSALDDGAATVLDPAAGVFLGPATPEAVPPRIGYLFPGQGAGSGVEGALARRFGAASDLPRPPAAADQVATAVAQPRIVRSSLEGLRVLSRLGITATGAVGHSLGELTALHWAGAMDELTVLALAAERGRVMADASAGGGAMASIAAGADAVKALYEAGKHGAGPDSVVIAGYNGPGQTVISGSEAGVERVRRVAAARGLATARIRVSHAFHSPFVAPAAEGLDRYLEDVTFKPVDGGVVSTVTGDALAADADLRQLLVRQVREPVRFDAALRLLAADTDLLIEIGPGRILSGLATEIAPDVPAIAMDTESSSLAGLLSAVAAAYVLGAPVQGDALVAGRFTRPLPLDKEFRFFASPCESVPVDAPSLAAAESMEAPTGTATAELSGGDSAEPAAAGGSPAAADSLLVLRRLAAERAELPLDTVHPETHPLDELHLSSITVGQIMSQATQELGVPAPVVTSNFATSTLADLARELDDIASTAVAADAGSDRPPDGVAPWVRAFTVDLVQQDRPTAAAQAAGDWQVFAPAGHPLAEALGRALPDGQLGGGVLLCLPRDCTPDHAVLMLDAARAALAGQGRFVAVQDRRGASGLAKTLHLEAPEVPVTVVTVPLPDDLDADRATRLAAAVVADVAATTGFSEVLYDEAGTRSVPMLRPVIDLVPDSGTPLTSGDVVLVSGGGKGITAECALALARETGAAVGLLGRSDPAADGELAANLARFDAAEVTYSYTRADVTAPDEVAAAVAAISTELGPVTAVLHGAGHNEPASLSRLDEQKFRRTLAPKIDGLDAIMAAVDPARLRLLVTFGSIIGRAGLRGQADYATANDWLTDLTARYAETLPDCRCVALEWSVWAGAGMGERLGVLESLIREGVSPISLDDGITTLLAILGREQAPSSLVIMSRADDLPTVTLVPRELPLVRFLDRPLVHYPGIELVADTELSTDTDLYLADHLLDGDLVFPAVLGMEAMAEAGAALTGSGDPPMLEDVEFLRPIVVPADGSSVIRIAALRHGDSVDVAIRCAGTGFQADHFRARLRYPAPSPADDQRPDTPAASVPVPLDPGGDLYGGILFQGQRFQRILGYQKLAAKSCVAEISATGREGSAAWFGSYLPGTLLLGDPGARDAFMHAIQCCVPDATLLPVAIERIYPAVTPPAGGQFVLHAAERQRTGDTYLYDLDVRDSEGRLFERWEGLRLQAARKTGGRGPWVPVLLGPYLERRIDDYLAGGLRCVVEPGSGDGDGEDGEGDGEDGGTRRRGQTRTAVSRVLGHPAEVTHRGDGRPEVAGEGAAISVSHGADVTLAVAGQGKVGCDIETVRNRSPQDWRGLLGPRHFSLAELIQNERGEDQAVAATRVWGAVESLRKIGRVLAGPITLAPGGEDGWVLLQAGPVSIASFVSRMRDQRDPVVFTLSSCARDCDGGGQ